MRKYVFIMLIIVAIATIWLVQTQSRSSLDATSKYSNGQIITNVKVKNIQNIVSTEYSYTTYFLEQYVNVLPAIKTFSFPNYKSSHVFEIQERLLEGKKDNIKVQIIIKYNDGEEEIMKNVDINDIKKKLYDDLIIQSEIKDDKIYYSTNGLTAIVDKDKYDKDIVFYSNPNNEYPNISVGFQKDFTLYPLKQYGAIPKSVAVKNNYEGMAPVEFIKKSTLEEDYLVVEYGMIELPWDGLYPYDLSGNSVYYEGEKSELGINLFKDNQIVEVSKVSHEKYDQMLNKIPYITFVIP
ncbi:hypothetical protein [Brassicibacter mesophilus]|uniref:hypothetical protein n=1 Tax=Brassicibacter mesophilus TaxID=745119 RepID=UPI003D24F3B9